MKPFLLKPFGNVAESFRFSHHANVELNEINSYTNQIFTDEDSFVEVSKLDVAEWSTASFYTIGYAYEEFCQDIMNSPAPGNLSESDLQQYWEMINQQWILPLQSEALKYYRTNEKLAAQHGITNEWIKKTQARSLALNERLANFTNSNSNTIVKQASTTVPPKRNQNIDNKDL